MYELFCPTLTRFLKRFSFIDVVLILKLQDFVAGMFFYLYTNQQPFFLMFALFVNIGHTFLMQGQTISFLSIFKENMNKGGFSICTCNYTKIASTSLFD